MNDIKRKKENINDFLELINNSKTINDIFIKYFEKDDKSYLINDSDSKVINFIIKILFKSKYNRYHLLLRKRRNYNKINTNPKINFPKELNSTKLIIKLINIYILNEYFFSNYINVRKEILNRKIYFFIKKLFIKDILTAKDLDIILGYNLIMCLYSEKYNFMQNHNPYINNNIKNLEIIYSLIIFLISFTKNNLEEQKKSEFIEIVKHFVKNIETILLKDNINNIMILSRNDYLINLIKLSKISKNISTIINPLLVKIYKNKLNFDFFFSDLSEIFTLNNDETIESHTNNLIAKNSFLNDLFYIEEHNRNQFLINSGFIFNNDENNGIICSLPYNKSKNFSSDGFSIVISFCVFKNNNNNKYNIFAFKGNKDNEIMNLYLENSILKLNISSKSIELFADILINTNYVFWLIFPKDKNKQILIFLNGKKSVINLTQVEYPIFEYKEILLGFNKESSIDNKSINNFEGILGTFILFNGCLINDKNDFKNEMKLKELKGDYEMAIQYKSIREFIYVNKNLKTTLNKFQLNIIDKIEVIISPKSIGNINDIKNINNNFICDYYGYDKSEKDKEYYTYKFVSDKSLLNNITYPFEYSNNIFEFFINHGLVYLRLELYYLLAALSFKIKEKKSNDKNNENSQIYLNEDEIKEMNENLNLICLLFFSCLQSSIYTNQIYKDVINVNEFFYTLNDLVSINVKYGCKLRKILLTLVINNLDFLLNNDLLMNKCDFTFIYDNYDINDNQIFELLFDKLSAIFKDDYIYQNKEILIEYIFNKIINFDKIYLSDETPKETKKKYSELIQELIVIAIKEKKYHLLENYLYNLEKNIDEINSYLLDFKEKTNIFYIDEKSKEEQDKKNFDNNIDEKNGTNNLNVDKIINIKLVYKYLKNLFVSINSNSLNNKFKIFCSEKKSLFSEFFNGLIIFLSQDFDPIITQFQNYKINNKTTGRIFKGYYSEIIKSLCILFLDKIYITVKKQEKYYSNSHITNYIPSVIRKSFSSVKSKLGSIIYNNDNSNNIKSQSIVEKKQETESINNFDIINNIDLNANNDEKNNLNSIFKDFEFIKEINFSTYTLVTLYILIYQDQISSKEMIKIIKNIENNQEQFIKNNNFKLSEDIIINKKPYFDLMNLLIENLDKDSDNYKLIKLYFELGCDVMLKISEFYKNKYSENKDEILGYFFNYKDNCIFNLALNYLVKLANETINEENYDKNNNISKNYLEKFSNLIKDNLIIVIYNSLFICKDPFYFVFLNKCYINNYIDFDFIFGAISLMINKYLSFIDEDSEERRTLSTEYIDKLLIFELNNKDILYLIYKLFFFVTKRKLIIDNISLMDNIHKYLSFFLSNSKLLYIKILFPIEDNQSKLSNKKLIIEIIYEIIIEIYMEFIRDPKKKYLECFEDLMFDILHMANFTSNRFNKDLFELYIPKNKKKKSSHTFFYILDKISFKKNNLFKISDGKKINTEKIKKLQARLFDKYKDEYDEKENIYSVCIIFMIKILISIKSINEILENSKNNEENFHLKSILSQNFNLICQDCYKINKKFSNLNPLMSEGKYNKDLYIDIKNFIIKEYKNKKNYDVNNFIHRLLNFASDLKYFSRVIYNSYGKIMQYRNETFNKIIKNSLNPEVKTDSNIIMQNFSENSTASDESKIQIFHKAKTSLKKSNNHKKYNLCLISNKDNIKSKENIEQEKNIFYIEKSGLKKDIIGIYFSNYFQKVLNYDKDFNTIKKLYKYLYKEDIKDLDEFNDFNYPIKIKNYMSNHHYFKPFFKKDFNFFDSGYLQYSHKFLYKFFKNKSIDDLRSKLIVPSKEISLLSDYPNNNINYENIKSYYCELLTNNGSIFGKFFIFENGILFLSDCKNDKRNNEDYLEYVFSTTKFDILISDKKIFLDFSTINEIINRKFCCLWTSQEFFMKNGKSFFFNFFTEKSNEQILDIYKIKLKKYNYKLIQNPKEYFEKEEFTKKWKDNIITTYEYLLALNKYSGRSYNNTIEYPIIPWIKFENKIRDFNLPISLQTEEAKADFEDKYLKYRDLKMDFYHNNHYSNSSYIIFYLSRINPFTNGMIRLQGNSFEVPERQFTSINSTIQICPKTFNNREAIPELFEIPEIYYNINCNDFGTSLSKKREHNIDLTPYANNGIELCYDFLDQINNNKEINNNINKWIDFIFGVNQYNNNTKEIPYRRFNDEFYAQNSNFKKLITELKEKKTDNKEIYKTIKNEIGSPLNFGICPYQILNDFTPKRNILNQNIIDNNDKIDEVHNIKIAENKLYTDNVIYFSKNKKNKNIIILYENGLLNIFSPKKKHSNEYELFTEIKITGLLYPNLVAKYTFCELKDNLIVFCGFFDKTLRFYQKDINKFNYLLDIYTTSIISITENEFVTGHFSGRITKWELITKINNNNTDYELKKIIQIKSNKNTILCIEYDRKLNIILCCDNNSIIIRNYYNFEFFKNIHIKKSITPINKIIKLKIFNCNLIYVLVMLNDNRMYEFHCYSLNGTFHKKIQSNFTDFKITKTGNIITNNLNNRELIFYKGCHLDILCSKSYQCISENKNRFLFDFENPNIIYLCCKQNQFTSIKKVIINTNEDIEKNK